MSLRICCCLLLCALLVGACTPGESTPEADPEPSKAKGQAVIRLLPVEPADEEDLFETTVSHLDTMARIAEPLTRDMCCA